MEKDNKIIIGKIGAARGLAGEVKVTPLTDFTDRFDDLQSVNVDNKILTIDYVKYIGNNLIIKFKNYETRESAQSLNGKLIKVDKSEAAPLAEGEFYTFDIIGLDVLDLEKNKLGVVTNVLKTGSNDVFVVQLADGREMLIPALKVVVKKIDIPNKNILIDINKLESI